MLRLQGRHYATGIPLSLECADGLIRHVATQQEQHSALSSEDWIAPAFFDLQINGCGGYSFTSQELSSDHIAKIIVTCRQHGIGSFCPTVVTSSAEVMMHSLRTLARSNCFEAVHLEGPYISAEDGPRGAHPREYVRPPDWNEFLRFQDAANGCIRLVTLAPELPGAMLLIERLVHDGVVVALGHTSASAEQIDEAVSAGARLSTHLGNGTHALLPRHDNYIWHQLADDRLWASVICDGHHLPLSVLRSITRVKTPARLILTCDAGSLAGLPAGRYREWDQDFEIDADGRIRVAGTPYLAGSGLFTDACVRHAIGALGLNREDCIDMAGERPRQLLGLRPRRLQAGDPADLILFRSDEAEPFRLTGIVHADRLISLCKTG